MTNEQQILVDRMVDGELDNQQQRELLLACDNSQAWRELALAYVESQAWGSELTSLMEEAKVTESDVSVGPNKEARLHSDWKPYSLAVAILLSLGVGYGLGWIVQDAPGPRIVATENKEGEAPDGDEARLSSMRFTVADPSTNGLRQVDLPVVRASDLGPNWLQQLEPSLPEDFVQEIRGSGLDIKRTRTYMPVDLGDGRRVVVPIDYYIEQDYQ